MGGGDPKTMKPFIYWQTRLTLILVWMVILSGLHFAASVDAPLFLLKFHRIPLGGNSDLVSILQMMWSLLWLASGESKESMFRLI